MGARFLPMHATHANHFRSACLGSLLCKSTIISARLEETPSISKQRYAFTLSLFYRGRRYLQSCRLVSCSKLEARCLSIESYRVAAFSTSFTRSFSPRYDIPILGATIPPTDCCKDCILLHGYWPLVSPRHQPSVSYGSDRLAQRSSCSRPH